MASGRDLESIWQQIVQLQVDVGLDPGFPLSESLNHILRPILESDVPERGQPSSNASQQIFIILIVGRVDASATRALQEIMPSRSQNRPVPLQPSPPGQSAPHTMPENANQVHAPSPSLTSASSPSQFAQLDAPTDALPLCPVCGQSFGRSQERVRHILKHLPRWLYCNFPDCPWRGDRSYTLSTHWAERHADFGEAPNPEDCKIYNPFPLVQSVIKGELLIEEMVAIAVQAVTMRSQKLGKVGIWEGEWGRRH